MEKNYGFQKWYEKNNSVLEFTFNGYLEENDLSIDKIEILLDKCFESMPVYQNINLIMTWIQTILKDFKDDDLQLSLLDKNGKEIKVEFKNKKLVYFETNEEIERNKTLNTTYSLPLNFHTCILGKDLNKEKSLEIYEEKIKDIMQQISKLENISPIKLDERGKQICRIYKLFYEENPDFSSEDISTKMQTMFLIVEYFKINLPYKFLQTDKNSLPTSLDLERDIKSLIPLGEITADTALEMHYMSARDKQIIKYIGDYIRNYANNQIENLEKISIILFTKYQMDLYGTATVGDVCTKLEYSISDVNGCFQLMKTINKQISKDN